MLVDELAQQIFEGRHSRFHAEIIEWLSSSRRFRAFTEEHQSKIRKKLRIATEDAMLLDLRCELETAYRLLQAKKFSVEYEKYGQGGGRAPDLTVTFRTHTPFNVEVTRPRIIAAAVDRLMDTLCEKIGQMRAGELTLLLIYAPGTDSRDLVEAAKSLRLLAERQEEAYFLRRRFKNARDFLQQYQNLSMVGLNNSTLFLWRNPLARKTLPEDLLKTLYKTF